MGKLNGKVAMITGAGRGHAEAVTRLFAKEGAAVAMLRYSSGEPIGRASGR